MHYPNEGTPTVATTVEADNLVRYGWSTACLLGWSVLEPKAETFEVTELGGVCV